MIYGEGWCDEAFAAQLQEKKPPDVPLSELWPDL